MGSEFVKGVDRHIWPVFIESGSDTFLVRDSGGTLREHKFSEGLYYCGLGIPSSSNIQGTSLFQELIDDPDLNLTVVEATSGGSSYSNVLDNRFLTFTFSETTDILFSEVSFTLDPRLFGWPSDASNELNARIHTSPKMYWGAWTSMARPDGTATRKEKENRRVIGRSSPDRADGKGRTFRRLEYRPYFYEHVPGAHVHPNRAEDDASANTGEVAQGDDHNTFIDLWGEAVEEDENGHTRTVIVVHDEGDGSNAFDSISSTTWEAYRMVGDVERPMENLSELRIPGGEFYDIEFETRIFDGSYTQ